MTRRQTDAAVFILGRRLLPDAGRCIDYCMAQGYNMKALFKDDWREAVEYVDSGEAEVLVVADFDQSMSPRIEVVTDRIRAEEPTGGRERRCRTSRINRRDAGDRRTNRRAGEE